MKLFESMEFDVNFIRLLILHVMKLTEQEKELIEAIRNFKRSRHNPSHELEIWIVRLFEKLLYEV